MDTTKRYPGKSESGQADDQGAAGRAWFVVGGNPVSSMRILSTRYRTAKMIRFAVATHTLQARPAPSWLQARIDAHLPCPLAAFAADGAALENLGGY